MDHISETRAVARRSSLYAVTVVAGDRRIPGKVRDHSETGCRITLDEPVRADDEKVEVERDGMTVRAAIAWRKGATVGLTFEGTPPAGMFAPRRIETAPVSGHVIFSPEERTRRPGLRVQAGVAPTR